MDMIKDMIKSELVVVDEIQCVEQKIHIGDIEEEVKRKGIYI